MRLIKKLFGKKPARGPLQCDQCREPVSFPVDDPERLRVGVVSKAKFSLQAAAIQTVPRTTEKDADLQNALADLSDAIKSNNTVAARQAEHFAGPLDKIGLSAAFCKRCEKVLCARCLSANRTTCKTCGGTVWRYGIDDKPSTIVAQRSDVPESRKEQARDVLELLLRNHVQGMKKHFSNHPGFPNTEPRWARLFESEVLRYTMHGIENEMPKSIQSNKHHWRGRRFDDLYVAVSTVPVAEPSAARSYFSGGYVKFLNSLFDDCNYSQGAIDIAHWTMCSSGARSVVHLTYVPPWNHVQPEAQSHPVVLVQAQDLMTESERADFLTPSVGSGAKAVEAAKDVPDPKPAPAAPTPQPKRKATEDPAPSGLCYRCPHCGYERALHTALSGLPVVCVNCTQQLVLPVAAPGVTGTIDAAKAEAGPVAKDTDAATAPRPKPAKATAETESAPPSKAVQAPKESDAPIKGELPPGHPMGETCAECGKLIGLQIAIYTQVCDTCGRCYCPACNPNVQRTGGLRIVSVLHDCPACR